MSPNRPTRGFGYGVAATIAMSIPMVIALASGLSPMPQPIPKAVLAAIFGGTVPIPVLLALAVTLHLAYGGAFGALLAEYARPVTVAKGLGLGVVLWGIMQVAVLPYLGWGAFGTAITPKIAAATLALHLVYGVTLGWTMDRGVSEAGQLSAPTG